MLGTGEARNFKFGTCPISRMTKYPQTGRGQGPGAEFLNFGTPPYIWKDEVKH